MENRLPITSHAFAITKQNLIRYLALYRDKKGLTGRISNPIEQLRSILNSVTVSQLKDDEVLPDIILNQIDSLAQSSIKHKEPSTVLLFRKILSDLNDYYHHYYSNLNEESAFSLIPLEIWQLILDQVSDQDIKNIRSTCQTLKKAAFFKASCPDYEASDSTSVQWSLPPSRPCVMDISPNGKMIAIACNGILQVLNMKREIINTLKETSWASGLKFTKDNQSIAFYEIATGGPHIFMWKISEDTAEKINIDEYLSGSGNGGLMTLTMLSDGNMVVAINQEYSDSMPHLLGVINPQLGTIITSFKASPIRYNPGYQTQEIQLSQNERLLAYRLPAPYDEPHKKPPPPIIYIFDILTGKSYQTITLEKNSRLTCFAFTHDNHLICCYHIYGEKVSKIQLWDSMTGKKINKPLDLKIQNDNHWGIHGISVSGKHIALFGYMIGCILRYNSHTHTFKRLNYTYSGNEGINCSSPQVVFNKNKLAFLSNCKLTLFQFPPIPISAQMAKEENDTKERQNWWLPWQ